MGETRESAEDPFKGDGTDWTWLYVIIFLIPVIFLAIAVYSTWRDRRAAAAKAKNDLETGRAAKLDRYYHPWKYDAAESSSAAGRNGANRSKLTIVTAATTTATTTTAESAAAAASAAAAGKTTSRHPNNPWEPATPRSGGGGGGSNNNINNRRNHNSLTPVTPRSRYSTNPYRPQEYQQQQHQQESSSDQDVDAAPYLPRPTAPLTYLVPRRPCMARPLRWGIIRTERRSRGPGVTAAGFVHVPP
ncbi:hypothetical protein PG997_013900 [Apiospora hydei]|uniref:Uncharacterized protein n=1 Tax=Apiospora hydei TaxID=1337664 RepID=A0ABR1V7J1_9PEZI